MTFPEEHQAAVLANQVASTPSETGRGEHTDITEPGAAPSAPSSDFNKWKQKIDGRISSWESTEVPRITNRRALRAHRVNVQRMRDEKKIAQDETIVPDRTIQQNVLTQKTQFVRFFDGMSTVLVFGKPPNFPDVLLDNLRGMEKQFTAGMRYPRFKLPYYRSFDGTCLHGASWFEVTFDASKPFHCAIESVRREDLIFSTDTTNLQGEELLLRRFHWTITEIEGAAAAYKFDEKQVAHLRSLEANSATRAKKFNIYRVYMKVNGVVQYAWYSKDCQNAWLAGMVPLDLGLLDFPAPEVVQAHQLAVQQNAAQMVAAMQTQQPLPPPVDPLPPPTSKAIRFYPFFVLPLDETEDQVILDIQGRGALDQHVQEAMTSIMSSTVNAAYRASQLYPTVDPGPNSLDQRGGALKELGPIKPGVLMNKPVKLMNFPWPSPILLAITQALAVRNQQQMGRVDFAAMTRDDTEKTAKEMEISATTSDQLSSLQIELLDNVIVDLNVLCWYIARDQSRAGKLSPENTLPAELLDYNYSFSSSGDIEVRERAERLAALKEAMALLGGTPLAMEALKYFLQLEFPEKADQWEKILAAGDPSKALNVMATIVATALETGRLQVTPEENAIIQQILSTIQSAMAGGPSDPGAAPGPQGGANGTPTPGGSPQSAGGTA